MSDRFLSQGHADRFDAVVWANDAARAARDGLEGRGDFADGSQLVEEALGRAAADGGAVGLLVMEKREGTWRFVAMGPDGEVVDDARVAACAACHRDAPRDFVFPTPAMPVAAIGHGDAAP